MLLHGKIENSGSNGPGNRAVIWFQGCTLNCPGCWNPDTHAFAGPQVDEDEVFNWLTGLAGIEGVTFSGGEPMQHYPALEHLTRRIRTETHLSIGMFTGYTVRELESGRWQYRMTNRHMFSGTQTEWSIIRGRLDFAVCGRYNRLQHTTNKPLCGSTNQSVELFSTRYALSDFSKQTFEVTIAEDGSMQVTGFPSQQFLQSISLTGE